MSPQSDPNLKCGPPQRLKKPAPLALPARREPHISTSGYCMKIAQVAPLYESVPPKLYGGTERVVSYLTEELVRLGHDVTLFASGDSVTGANLVPCAPKSLRLDRSCIDQIAH